MRCNVRRDGRLPGHGSRYFGKSGSRRAGVCRVVSGHGLMVASRAPPRQGQSSPHSGWLVVAHRAYRAREPLSETMMRLFETGSQL